MRSLGHLSSPDLTTRFGDYLYVQGIENQLDTEDDGTCSIWVLDDAQLPQAAALLERFRTTPDAPEFTTAGTAASRKRASEARAEKARRSTVADTARIGYEKHFGGFAWLPACLIAISVAVALYSQVGDDLQALRYFLIAGNFPGQSRADFFRSPREPHKHKARGRCAFFIHAARRHNVCATFCAQRKISDARKKKSVDDFAQHH